jgi:predicted dehydrogenase
MTVRVGVIGLGFMGRVHVQAYQDLARAGVECSLCAVADADAARLTGYPSGQGNLAQSPVEALFDPASVRTYRRAEDLIADPNLDLVSICTPTDTHVPLALAALHAGKHILIEKPIALTTQAIDKLRSAAAAASRLAIPAMCMRFWPGWTWLKDRIAEGPSSPLGRLHGLTFTRMGAPPSWSQDFYLDESRSGGALFDLHIHDADFILYCFGPPAAVTTTGTTRHLSTTYHYPRGPRMTAEGGWGPSPGFPFRMRFTACFEHATADFDLSRENPLMLASEGRFELVPLLPESAYHSQAHAAVSAVLTVQSGSTPHLRATLLDSHAVTRLLLTERESLASGTTQTVP